MASVDLSRAFAAWAGIERFAGRSPTALIRLHDCSTAVANSCKGSEAQANTLKALGDLQARTARLREAELTGLIDVLESGTLPSFRRLT